MTPIPPCGSGYCTQLQGRIDVICHEMDRQPGSPILVEKDGKTCYCTCYAQGGGEYSPLAAVAIPEWNTVPMGEIVQGTTKVLAADTSLVFMSYVAQYASTAALRQMENSVRVGYYANGQVRSAFVLASAPFLLHGTKTLCRADRLKMTDKLIDADGLPVTITSIQTGTFNGTVAGVATKLEVPGPSYRGHLIVVDYVVVGDDAVEVSAATEHDDRPVVGSAEWKRENDVPAAELVRAPVTLPNGAFHPAEYYHVNVPEHASD
jgi:hypothetical protein